MLLCAIPSISPEMQGGGGPEGHRTGCGSGGHPGPCVEGHRKDLQPAAQEPASLIHALDHEYFKRVAAVEFAIKYDDGKNPWGLAKADLVIIGVSRTSKTPLSMYLANKQLKVANVPLVPEIPPPEELFKVPSSRIIGLLIDPSS